MSTAANPRRMSPAARRSGEGEAARRTFGQIVRDLLIEQGYTTAIGNPNWSQLSNELEDIQYESLRKAVTGDRHPSPKIMEAVAAFFGIEPTTFWEYQLWIVQREFDPKEVGEEAAFANLQKWLRTRK